jgi:hypothetical protein
MEVALRVHHDYRTNVKQLAFYKKITVILSIVLLFVAFTTTK